MARYWCKQCQVFVDDNKISRKSHEESFKHKNSVIRSISKLHKKNKDESREKFLAEKEIREIRKELGIKPEFKKGKVERKSKDDTKVVDDGMDEEEESKEPTIGEWSVVVESNELEEPEIITKPAVQNSLHHTSFKKQSAADIETKNWDISTKKQIDTSLSDSDENRPKTTFKKRKVKK